MFVNSNAGRIEIVDIDEDSKQVAETSEDNWDAGDEVILADWDEYGCKWTATKHIEGYQNENNRRAN